MLRADWATSSITTRFFLRLLSTGRLDGDEDVRWRLDLLIRCSMGAGISVMDLQKINKKRDWRGPGGRQLPGIIIVRAARSISRLLVAGSVAISLGDGV